MNNKFKLVPLIPFMMSALATQAQQLAYSPEMVRALIPNGDKVDLSFFEKGYDILPGVHRLNVLVNGEPQGTYNVELREENGKLEPVINANLLGQWKLKPEVYDRLLEKNKDRDLFPLSSYLTGVVFAIDSSEMTLDISIPQIFMTENYGWVDIAPREQWDNGEAAAVVNYSISASHNTSRYSEAKNSSLYASLNGRLNFGAWRLHSSASFNANDSKYEGGHHKDRSWELWNTYLQRDVPALTSALQLGEISTSGEIFESVPLRGIRMFTNESMLPSNQRSFSPIIEGVANTNAQIEIRQNGHTVHTVNVAAGPFRLENLPTFGNYGDLEVVIKEADGTERIMNVPYSSVPMMLKEGQYRYDVSVGRYYREDLGENGRTTPVIMGTLSYGLPNDITLYGGGQLANGYQAAAIGAGASLGRWGAVAADMIQSHVAKDPNRGLREASGAAWRIRYEKTMTNIGTTVNLANYQYLTGRYMSLPDYAEYGTLSYYLNNNLQSRWQLSMSQQLGSLGHLYIGGNYSRYRGDSADTKSFNIGYSTSIKRVGVSLNFYQNYMKYSLAKDNNWQMDRTLMLTLNIPVDVLFGGYIRNEAIQSTNITYQGSMNRDASGNNEYTQSVVMSGNYDNLNWSVSQDLGGSQDRSSAVRLSYSGDRLSTDVGYTVTKTNHNYQFGLSGALLAHKTGLTLTGPIYDSAVLFEVPGIAGAKIAQSFDSTTDFFGHGVVSYLTNYTRNEVSIDPSSLPDGAMLLDSSTQIVVPTDGAIIRVKYPVRLGQQCVFRLLDEEGNPVPFGSVVRLLDADKNVDPFVSGLVGADGRLYLTGLPENGVLQMEMKGKGQVQYEFKLEPIDRSGNSEFTPVPVIELSNPIY